MLAEDRFDKILQILEQKKTVTVLELTERLDTSESTIRRDLTELHKKGLLVKVHGGATVKPLHYNMKDDKVEVRQDQNREEKERIAAYAASLIAPDDFVFLDAGTTTGEMIEHLSEKNAVYVTNAVYHAVRLMKKGFRTYLIGGELKESTEAVVGAAAVRDLERYNFTKGFFGTNGASLERGFTTPDISEALVKETAMKLCREAYVLCDSSKFGCISPVHFAAFDDAKIITSTAGLEYRDCKNIVEADAL